MNQSSNRVDYSKYGAELVEEDEDEKPSTSTVDYSKYGAEPVEEKPEKEKVGWGKSILYGLAEGVLGLPAGVESSTKTLYGAYEDVAKKGAKKFEEATGIEAPDLALPFKALGKAREGIQEATGFDINQFNPLGKSQELIESFPESEDQTSRRLRVGAATLPVGAVFGIPGIIAGLVGSQAGQTVREVYGKDGKFDEFGLGELSALGADVLAGGVAGAAASIARGGARAVAQQSNRVPAIFERPQGKLQTAVVKHVIQGEKNALDNIINNFSTQQVQGFEREASQVSPNRYTQLVNSDAAAIQQTADNMYRQNQLSLISNLAPTPEQGGQAIQAAANTVFQDQVLNAERALYTQARDASQGLVGQAPRTIGQAKALLAELTKSTPTPEQQPVVAFLRGLIEDLETTTPASSRPASTLLDASGKPLVAAMETPASTAPTPRTANDLVDLVQRSNQAVNYGSELRYQSHRLAPIINTLRQEVGSVLNQNPAASNLYQQANALHANNANTWGTRYMRSVRFSENPETIIGKTKLASNMRNLKTAIADPEIQNLAERMVVEDITRSGSATSNRNALNALGLEIRPVAREAAEGLVNVKDPLTNAGGRASVRNQVLKDAAQSVNTGKRPERILDLMQTPKGYALARESLNATPESRRLFQSFERLFLEDIFNSVRSNTGEIDFTKARNLLKNNDVREVIRRIGGDRLLTRFSELQGFAQNLERNINLFKAPETQSFFSRLGKETKSAGMVGAMLHSLGIPLPLLAGLGFAKGIGSGAKISFQTLQSKILQNPRAVRALESISTASTTEQVLLAVQRLQKYIEKESDSD